MSDPDREASRVWRAWKTIHEMVADRVRPPGTRRGRQR